MLAERVAFIRHHFAVEFIDYGETRGRGVLLSSGCGIGMGVMDVEPELRWYVDVDRYRGGRVDWEALAIILFVARPSVVAFAGWFTFDTPAALEGLRRGVVGDTPFVEYVGGKGTLGEMLSRLKELRIGQANRPAHRVGQVRRGSEVVRTSDALD